MELVTMIAGMTTASEAEISDDWSEVEDEILGDSFLTLQQVIARARAIIEDVEIIGVCEASGIRFAQLTGSPAGSWGWRTEDRDLAEPPWNKGFPTKAAAARACRDTCGFGD